MQETKKVTVWEEQLNKMLDRVAFVAEDWDELQNMLAKADNPKDRKELHAYLNKTIQNIERQNHKLNRIVYNQDPKGFYIYNYTFDMYKWYKKRKFDASLMTPYYLFIGHTELTTEEWERFMEKRYE